MASIARSPHSTRANPSWYVQYREADGQKRTRKLDGARTETEARKRLREIETRVAAGLPGMLQDEPKPVVPVGTLVTTSIETWSHTLTNRNAVTDGQQVRKHLVKSPALTVALEDFGLGTVKAYVAELAASKMSGGSQRRMFTYLGRWCSWAVGEELIAGNPCRDLPWKQRPVYDRGDPTAKPWVEDDATLARLMGALPYPLDLALWLGNRTGLRLGETFGLRLSDLTGLHDKQPTIRVARSFAGPMKESKHGEWRVKYVPAPSDTAKVLGKLIAARKAVGGPDSLLFVPETTAGRSTNDDWAGFLPHTINALWRQVQATTGFKGTWKDATRHSFATRNIMAGVSVSAVSHALGHASVTTTERNYAHVIKYVAPAELHAPGEVRRLEAQKPADTHARDRAPVRRLAKR